MITKYDNVDFHARKRMNDARDTLARWNAASIAMQMLAGVTLAIVSVLYFAT